MGRRRRELTERPCSCSRRQTGCLPWASKWLAGVDSPCGQLWVPRLCQCVDGRRRSHDTDTSIPYSVLGANAVLDALPGMAGQVIEGSARRPVAAPVACFLGCLRLNWSHGRLSATRWHPGLTSAATDPRRMDPPWCPPPPPLTHPASSPRSRSTATTATGSFALGRHTS